MHLNFRSDGTLTLPQLFDATVALDVKQGTPGCDPNAKPGDLRPCFDPKSYQPDLIVVNLGTNDSNETYCPDGSLTCEYCRDPSKCDEKAGRQQRSRDPDSAATKLCASEFADCIDKTCGLGSATNLSCVVPTSCVDGVPGDTEKEGVRACLAKRLPDDQGRYVDKYSAFLKKLRADYGPTPRIVAVLGPMVSNYGLGGGPDEVKKTLANYIRTAIASTGDPRTDFLQLDTHFYIQSSGCDYHPSAITDRVMAKRLERLVRMREPSW
jgi:hypothetical protein